jgi:Domain of unknown function (DUF4173)
MAILDKIGFVSCSFCYTTLFSYMSSFNTSLVKKSILGYSLFLAFSLFGGYYFNYLAVAIFGISFVSIVIFFKMKSDKHVIDFYDWAFYSLSILASLLFIIRTDFLTLFFAFSVFLYSSSWLILNKFQKYLIGETWWNFFFTPFINFFKIWGISLKKNDWYKTVDQAQDNKDKSLSNNPLFQYLSKVNWANLILGIFIAIIVSLFILPFLISSNPIFEQGVRQIGERLNDLLTNFTWLINLINALNIFDGWFVIRLATFVYFSFYIPKLIVFLTNTDIKENIKAKEIYDKMQQTSDKISDKNNEKQEFNLVIPKFVISIILFLFLITQIQLYTASLDYLNSLGYSLGRYTNEVFFQLSFVVVIIIFLLYIDLKKTKLSKVLTFVLLGEGLGLVLSAFRSVWIYITTWGFTHKRLYGVFLSLFLISLLGIFLTYTLKKLPKLFEHITLLVAFTLILIGVVNFDYLIYNFNQPRETKGVAIDYVRYVNNVSVIDSFALKREYQKRMTFFETNPKKDSYFCKKEVEYCNEKDYLIATKNTIERLQKKYGTLKRYPGDNYYSNYQNNRFFDFNFIEYLNYLQIKDIDTTRAKDYIKQESLYYESNFRE